MKRIVLVFGLVIGTILCANMVFMVNLFLSNPDFKANDLLGYAAMVVLFSLIYFGVRNYRNKQLGGVISFGHAFKTGLWMVLIASTLYVVVWLIYYYYFVPDFMDRYVDHVLKQCSADDLAAKTAEMNSMKEMYKNPLWVILFTFMEVLPVGLIVALISALILKKKKAMEAAS